MKDLFVGLMVGMIAGAAIGSCPKGRKVIGEIKTKMSDCDCGCKESESRAADGCYCGERE